ncbi:hypothetical protein ACJX0J_035795, partial [Zea mays]
PDVEESEMLLEAYFIVLELQHIVSFEGCSMAELIRVYDGIIEMIMPSLFLASRKAFVEKILKFNILKLYYITVFFFFVSLACIDVKVLCRLNAQRMLVLMGATTSVHHQLHHLIFEL